MKKSYKLPVILIIDRFLMHQQVNASRSTFKWYSNFCRKFATSFSRATVGDITPAAMEQWVRVHYGKQSPSTQHGAARAVVRALNWAVANRIIDSSPLVGYRKPTPNRREFLMSRADYALCLKIAQPHLKKVVQFLWHTGARPAEVRLAHASFVQGPKLIYPRTLSKGKRRRRIIYLDDIALGIVRHRLRTGGELFRSHSGRPWTANSLRIAFRRLQQRTGIAGLCCYSFRHAWITGLLEKGVDVATVAELAGNSPRMVLDHYSHVGKNEKRLLAVL